MRKTVIGLVLLLAAASSCCQRAFTTAERELIAGSDSLMYVTTMPADSAVLRTPCAQLSSAELASPLAVTLVDKMLHTVQHPSQDGVGIAAPQVGISRRVICVQRFDKEGEPFEGYLNPRIDSLIGPEVVGPEGCLSIPGLRGMVPRSSEIVLTYVRPGTLEPVTERISGFTAIIFQHECDHLDGILYTDRAIQIFEKN